MGSGTYSRADYTSHTSTRSSTEGFDYATASPNQIFTQSKLAPELDPKGVAVRESRDSADHPRSTALIVALDESGSMETVLTQMARDGMNRLVMAIYDRRPISDPHVMAMGFGDAEMGDKAPLQVTQFEADVRIQQQLERIWLEGGGGGNRYEGYALPWYFAARHTSIDCFEKRGEKGFLFTVGDEDPTPRLRHRDIERVLGYAPSPSDDLSAEALLEEVSRKWEVFHVIVAEGRHARRYPDSVRSKWQALLGQRALWLADYRRMPEVIVSAIQLARGADYDEVVGSWGDAAGDVVTSALTRGISLSGIHR